MTVCYRSHTYIYISVINYIFHHLLCIFKCLLKLNLVRNFFPHWSHLWILAWNSFLWDKSFLLVQNTPLHWPQFTFSAILCLTRLNALVKTTLHSSHLLLCFFMCIRSNLWVQNLAGHWSHTNLGFPFSSLACSCLFRFLTLVNNELQSKHSVTNSWTSSTCVFSRSCLLYTALHWLQA